MSYHNCNTLYVDINVVKSSCASKFRKFESLSFAGLKATIIECMLSKTCDLDPLPNSILKKCIDLLLPAIHQIFNLSLYLGYWFSTYLNNRSYFVKGAGWTSHTLYVKFGVSQSSILGPVLFNLYFKSADLTANSHGLFVHSYADDMQFIFLLIKIFL